MFGHSTSYATARTTANYMEQLACTVGQMYASPNYICHQIMLKFEIPAISPTTTVLESELVLKLDEGAFLPSTNFVVEVRHTSWDTNTGPPDFEFLDFGDFLTPTSASSYPLLGSASTTTIQDKVLRIPITLPTSMDGNIISPTSNLVVTLMSNRQRLSTTPVGEERISLPPLTGTDTSQKSYLRLVCHDKTISFRGIDMGRYGLTFPEQEGFFDLPHLEQDRKQIPGRDWTHSNVKHASERTIVLKGHMVAANHDQLIEFRRALSLMLRPPGSDPDAYYQLRRPDVDNKHLLAQCTKGFRIAQEGLPYQGRYLPIQLEFDCLHPYWLDDVARTLSVTGSSGLISVNGDERVFPRYTARVVYALANGLSFTVNGETFVYSAPLAAGDRLIIAADVQNVHKFTNSTGQTTPAFGPTAGSSYPYLKPGSNSISKSSSFFVLDVLFNDLWR
jgi:hypothetical protein